MNMGVKMRSENQHGRENQNENQNEKEKIPASVPTYLPTYRTDLTSPHLTTSQRRRPGFTDLSGGYSFEIRDLRRAAAPPTTGHVRELSSSSGGGVCAQGEERIWGVTESPSQQQPWFS